MKLHKSIAASLAVCLLAGSCITPTAVSAADTGTALKVTVYGDATMDGVVDVSDAVLAARYVASDASANLTDNGKLNADTNLDGNVDGSDIIEILEFIAKKREYLGKADSAQGYKAHSLTEKLTAQEVTDKTVDDAFVKSQYDLTAKLMKEISFSDTAHDNILISPLSIASVLAMAGNGADGETRAELEKLLGGSISMEDLNEYYHNYLANLPSSDKAKLNVANSIWNSEELQIRDDYLQTVKDYYPNMDVFKAPFTDSTMGEINSWISDKTDDMIQNMLKSMDPNAVTYLINALAFDAEWETAWKGSYVTDFGLDTKQKVTMMTGSEEYYISDEYAEGFVKPYAGGTYSFVGILPRASKSVTLSDYIGMMDADSLGNLMDSRRKDEVSVRMPKFTFDYGTGDELLGNALQKLGVKKAFDGGKADFSRMYQVESGEWQPGDVYIGRVLHNTFIDVNETGTKAAAATIGEMTQKAHIARELAFDRPFIFMIIDERTKLPVFIGSVKDPQTDDAPQPPEQQELQKDEIRFTVLDADTGELISLDDDHPISINTTIAYHTEHGDMMTGPVYIISQNPYIVKDDLARHFNADVFSLSVSPYRLPDGYTLPDDNISWKKNENGSGEITVRLKKEAQALNDGEIRYTVVDADTDALIPLNANDPLVVNNRARSPEYSDQISSASRSFDSAMTANPFTVKAFEKNSEIEKYTAKVVPGSIPAGYTLPDNAVTVTALENNRFEVTVRLKAMSELKTDQVRITAVDTETGEQIALSDDNAFVISTSISYNTPNGKVSSGPPIRMNANPMTVDSFAHHFDADSFSMGINRVNVPAGYDLSSMAVTMHDNGSADVAVRLKPMKALKEGEVRFTVVDRYTGEPVTLNKNYSLLIYTDYIEQPEDPVLGLPVLTLDENPKTFANYANCCDPANNLHPVAHISSLSGRYELKANHMQMTQHSNGSYDVRILLDEIIYVPNN